MAFGIQRFSRRGSTRRAPMAEINVTPLVDVMLVLLVIFMVTAPLLKAGVPIDLPDSRAKALAEAEHPVSIAISRNGAVYLDDAPVAPGGLAAQLASLPKGADGKFKAVILRADKALDYGRVIAVMGELSRAGFTSITLVTQAVATESQTTSAELQPAPAEPKPAPVLTQRSGTEN